MNHQERHKILEKALQSHTFEERITLFNHWFKKSIKSSEVKKKEYIDNLHAIL